MGEGGLSPHYFLHSMQLSEAYDYIKGQDRRHRASWEQTRMIVNAQICSMGGEAIDMTFPWEEDKTPHKSAEQQEKEMEELKKLAAEMTKKLKAKNEKVQS